jgi:hypothetical protein
MKQRVFQVQSRGFTRYRSGVAQIYYEEKGCSRCRVEAVPCTYRAGVVPFIKTRNAQDSEQGFPCIITGALPCRYKAGDVLVTMLQYHISMLQNLLYKYSIK